MDLKQAVKHLVYSWSLCLYIDHYAALRFILYPAISISCAIMNLLLKITSNARLTRTTCYLFAKEHKQKKSSREQPKSYVPQPTKVQQSRFRSQSLSHSWNNFLSKRSSLRTNKIYHCWSWPTWWSLEEFLSLAQSTLEFSSSTGASFWASKATSSRNFCFLPVTTTISTWGTTENLTTTWERVNLF